MTQRLKPIWIYLSQKFLPLFTLQRPHFDDNIVSTGASTEAWYGQWSYVTADTSCTEIDQQIPVQPATLQWTTMMPNIEV